jgi:hypothetical protein
MWPPGLCVVLCSEHLHVSEWHKNSVAVQASPSVALNLQILLHPTSGLAVST